MKDERHKDFHELHGVSDAAAVGANVAHPLPWRAQYAWRQCADFSYPAWVVIDADGRDVKHWQINQDYPEAVSQELAERVVRAVNSHTELVAALENLLGAIGDPYRGQDRSMRLLTIVSGRPEYQAIDAAHAAIAKATGAQS